MSYKCIVCSKCFKNKKDLYPHIRNIHKLIVDTPKGALKDNIDDKITYSYEKTIEKPLFIYNDKLEKEALNIISGQTVDMSKALNSFVVDIKIEALKQISELTGLDFDYLIKKYLN